MENFNGPTFLLKRLLKKQWLVKYVQCTWYPNLGAQLLMAFEVYMRCIVLVRIIINVLTNNNNSWLFIVYKKGFAW